MINYLNCMNACKEKYQFVAYHVFVNSVNSIFFTSISLFWSLIKQNVTMAHWCLGWYCCNKCIYKCSQGGWPLCCRWGGECTYTINKCCLWCLYGSIQQSPVCSLIIYLLLHCIIFMAGIFSDCSTSCLWLYNDQAWRNTAYKCELFAESWFKDICLH